MNTIKEHIKQKQFSRVYLIYGAEGYLKRFYRNKLRDAALGDGDPMNASRFQGKGTDEKEVISIAETLPFFAERRVVVVEESGWFKTQSGMADYVAQIPETTVLIFVESEVDKRNRLYKAVKARGTVSEMGMPDERELKNWIAAGFKRAGKKITVRTAEALIMRTGTDMQNLENEIEKLICFTGEREVVSAEDVEVICSEQITGKVFQMLEAVGLKRQEQALQYYYDLLALRENPMSILFLTIRQLNLLMQIKDMSRLHMEPKAMASKAGVPPFAVGKYLAQAKNFSARVLCEAVEYGTGLEEAIKTGRITDRLAVELLLVKYSTRAEEARA